MKKKYKLILSAYNVHSGGGLVLLIAFLDALRFQQSEIVLFLDKRLEKIIAEKNWKVFLILPTLQSRLGAEHQIFKLSNKAEQLFIFNGMPPLFRMKCRVFIYLQNTNHLIKRPLSRGFKQKIRIFLERFWLRSFHQDSYHYFVQTESMKRLAEMVLNTTKNIAVRAFHPNLSIVEQRERNTKSHQFVYVASGNKHKNFEKLLDAWLILKGEKLSPTLSLIISPIIDLGLLKLLKKRVQQEGLEIEIITQITRQGLLETLSNAQCLIYPSLNESFGLPLVEAFYFKIDIIASERDYVRDVCIPVETFDPNSAVSIARAIKRYLNVEDSPKAILSPNDFVRTFFV